MNFSVNFMKRASAVLKEAGQLKKYKAMPKALAVIVGIFMLPLIIASYVFAAMVYVSGYMYAVASQPVKSLHALLKEEGQNVKHGTQVVIYFLSWGFVFSSYVLLTGLLVSLTVLYTIFSILTYLWTLGGFKFHVFASEEDIAIDVDGKYKNAVPVIFVCVMGALLLLIPGYKTLDVLIEYLDYEGFKITMKWLWQLFKYNMHSTDTLRLLVSALYAAFVFAPNPKK